MMANLPFSLLRSGARLCRSSFSISLLLFVATAPALADVNSWIKPGSGYWEEFSSWSLGELPDATQSIYITNAGWKAMAIGANTAQNFPDSMQIQELQIASPVDSYNVFLMNFSGFERPLQTTGLTVASNSAVVVQSSMLEVIRPDTNGTGGNVLMGGTFNQGDFSQVKVHGSLNVRSFGTSIQPWLAEPGRYFLTNGTLSVGGLENIGSMSGRGEFVQYGGSNNVGSLQVSPEGKYDLYDGQVTATNGFTIGFGDFASSASFTQYGGNVNADTAINGGYTLHGGTITGRMAVPPGTTYEREDGSVLQDGGTNFAVSLVLGPSPNRFGGNGFYVLSNGVLRVDSSVAFRGGQFSQYNGVHTIVSNLNMQSSGLPGLSSAGAFYFLRGGTLSAGGLTARAAIFQQDGGTNLIDGDVVLNAAPPPDTTQYKLAGGFLFARNVIIEASQAGGFRQTGGSIQITEKLTVQGATNGSFGFALEGGTLAVKDIYVGNGALFQHTGGNITHSGVLTLDHGDWYAATGNHALGPLQLSGQNTNSAINFPAGSSILRLANSSAQSWASSAVLYLTNWHGSASGGGETQLYFGSDASGLTWQQLALIKFNLSGALHPARILATGEVVPQTSEIPPLTFLRSGNTLTLTWAPGWTLQSSTNVAGPYQDVQGASSPYEVSMDKPSQFFRVRQ